MKAQNTRRVWTDLSSYHQGLLILALGTLLFSAKGILIKLAYTWQVTPTVLMSIRMLIALPFYLYVLLQYRLQPEKRSAFKALSPGQVLSALVLGLLGYYIASWLDLTGLLYLPASLERLILYSYPTFVLLLSVLFLGQVLSRGLLLSLLVIYAGLITVFLPDVQAMQGIAVESDVIVGGALVLASALSFAIFFVGSEVMMRHMPSKLYTAIAMIGASFAIIVHYLLTHEPLAILQQAPAVYAYGVAIAIFCTVLPSFMVAAGIKRVGAATGSMVGGVSPMMTLLLAFIFLQEAIDAMQALSFVLVIAGVLNLGRLQQKSG